MFDVTFPDGIRRGMAFDSPTHPKVFVTKNGSTISKKDWKRLKLLASDDLPPSPHVPSASDAEHRVQMLRHYLRGRGLDEESCDQACELARREMTLEEEEPVEDELPENALHGGYGGGLTGRSREPDGKRAPLGTIAGEPRSRSPLGEADFRSSPASDSADFERRFPEAARIKPGYEPPESERPLTRADRRRAHDLAMDANSADRLAEMFGEHFTEIGIGCWPSRR